MILSGLKGIVIKGGGVSIAAGKFIQSSQLTMEYNVEAVMVEIQSQIIVLYIHFQHNCSTEYFHNLTVSLCSLPKIRIFWLIVISDYQSQWRIQRGSRGSWNGLTSGHSRTTRRNRIERLAILTAGDSHCSCTDSLLECLIEALILI